MTKPAEEFAQVCPLAKKLEKCLKFNDEEEHEEMTSIRRVPALPGHPVTSDDVAYVHALIERALELGSSKASTITVLSKNHVDSRVTEIVWARLEEENPEFFDLYAAIERERQNNTLSRCSSSCSLSTQDVNNRVSPTTGYGLCL